MSSTPEGIVLSRFATSEEEAQEMAIEKALRQSKAKVPTPVAEVPEARGEVTASLVDVAGNAVTLQCDSLTLDFTVKDLTESEESLAMLIPKHLNLKPKFGQKFKFFDGASWHNVLYAGAAIKLSNNAGTLLSFVKIMNEETETSNDESMVKRGRLEPGVSPSPVSGKRATVIKSAEASWGDEETPSGPEDLDIE